MNLIKHNKLLLHHNFPSLAEEKNIRIDCLKKISPI